MLFGLVGEIAIITTLLVQWRELPPVEMCDMEQAVGKHLKAPEGGRGGGRVEGGLVRWVVFIDVFFKSLTSASLVSSGPGSSEFHNASSTS